jgi:hypothetical protein
VQLKLFLTANFAGAAGEKLSVPWLCYIGFQPDNLIKHRGAGQHAHTHSWSYSVMDYADSDVLCDGSKLSNWLLLQQEHMETWMFEYVQVFLDHSLKPILSFICISSGPLKIDYCYSKCDLQIFDIYTEAGPNSVQIFSGLWQGGLQSQTLTHF